MDYAEIISSVVRHTSIRMLQSLVTEINIELDQMDVKTTFLHGNFNVSISMQHPPGFINKSTENKVYVLKKINYMA